MSSQLDPILRAAQEQFARQSERYGRGHILENIADMEAARAPDSARKLFRLAEEDGKIVWWWQRLTLVTVKSA